MLGSFPIPHWDACSSMRLLITPNLANTTSYQHQSRHWSSLEELPENHDSGSLYSGLNQTYLMFLSILSTDRGQDMEFPYSGYVSRVHIKDSYFSSPYPQHQFLPVITSSYPKSFKLWVLSLLDFLYSISIFFHLCSFSIKKLRYLPWLSRLLPWVKKGKCKSSLRFYTNSIFPLRSMVGWTFPIIFKFKLA